MENDTNTKLLKSYSHIAYSTPNLKREEEIELLKQCINLNCQKSKQKIIDSYLRTVIFLAKRYQYRNKLDIDDLIQSGIVGIQNAISKFDLSKYKIIKNTGSSLFAYYCYRAILMEMKEYYRTNIRQFTVSDTLNTQLVKVNRLYKSGKLDLTSNETLCQSIQKHMGCKKSVAINLINLFKPSIEINKPIAEGENETHGNLITFHNSKNIENNISSDFLIDKNPSNIYEYEEMHHLLLKAINNLSLEDRDIIMSKYGINCEKKTITEISKKYKTNTTSINNRIKKIQHQIKLSLNK